MKWPFVHSIGILSDCTLLKFSYLQFETELKKRKNKKEWGRWKNTSWINISQGYLLTKGIKVPGDWEYADILFISIPCRKDCSPQGHTRWPAIVGLEWSENKKTRCSTEMPAVLVKKPKKNPPTNHELQFILWTFHFFKIVHKKPVAAKAILSWRPKHWILLQPQKDSFIKKANTALKIWPDYSHSKQIFSHHY